MKRILLTASVVALAMTALIAGDQSQSGGGAMTADALKAIQIRSIGPTISSGRIVDVAIDAKNPSVWYVASAFGGLW